MEKQKERKVEEKTERVRKEERGEGEQIEDSEDMVSLEVCNGEESGK